MPRLKVMLFDLWGTLIIYEGAGEDELRSKMRATLAADALASAGRCYPLDTIERRFVAAGDELGKVHAQGLDLSAEGRTVLYVRHLDADLLDGLDDAMWRKLHEAILTPALHARPRPMPGALETLASVREAGVPIGLVSNAGVTPGFVLREILDGHGLLEYFDHTIFSDEVEVSKPSAAIFEHALDAFGAAPHEAAFIGDQPVLDVLGPRAAGIWSIQYGHLSEDGIEPHARIATLPELVPMLRQMALL